MRESRIVQIIPADGWYAGYRSNDNAPADCWAPLACWALVKDEEGDTFVVGLDGESGGGSPERCDLTSNFSHYRRASAQWTPPSGDDETV